MASFAPGKSSSAPDKSDLSLFRDAQERSGVRQRFPALEFHADLVRVFPYPPASYDFQVVLEAILIVPSGKLTRLANHRAFHQTCQGECS